MEARKTAVVIVSLQVVALIARRMSTDHVIAEFLFLHANAPRIAREAVQGHELE